MATVTVYTFPDCVQCSSTFRALDKHGVEYSTVDLSQHPKKIEYFRDTLGLAQAPIVTAGADSWSGFRPDKITALANS